MKPEKNLRVLIDKDANAAIESMLASLKLKDGFVKINSSRLVSWIITKFGSESFEKHKAQIIQDHFNSKEYLRDLATKIQSSEDAANMLAAALQKIQSGNKKLQHAQKIKKERSTEKDRLEEL